MKIGVYTSCLHDRTLDEALSLVAATTLLDATALVDAGEAAQLGTGRGA